MWPRSSCFLLSLSLFSLCTPTTIQSRTAFIVTHGDRIREAFDVQLSSPHAINTIQDNLRAIAGAGDDDEAWASAALRAMEAASPTSLRVTADLLHHGQQTGTSFADSLEMELAAAKFFMQDSDFFEGVRAAIVDRDAGPAVWQTLERGTDTVAAVAAFREAVDFPSRVDLPVFDSGDDKR